MLVAMGTVQLDEFYPAVAIAALMRIMRDPALSLHHNTVIQVQIFNFKEKPVSETQVLHIVGQDHFHCFLWKTFDNFQRQDSVVFLIHLF